MNAYAWPVPERTEGMVAARPGRCANHPSVPGVGTCEVCGRPLCVACAVPVRGRLIGPECLPTILEDIAVPPPPPAPVRPHWDTLAMAGTLATLTAVVRARRLVD